MLRSRSVSWYLPMASIDVPAMANDGYGKYLLISGRVIRLGYPIIRW